MKILFRQLAMSVRCVLSLTIIFISAGTRAEVGQQCSPMSLKQSYDSWRSTMEELVPIPSWVNSSESCVSKKKMSIVNYGSICEMATGAEAHIAIALGPSKANGLLALTYHLPYSEKSIALTRKLSESGSLIALKNAPKFMQAMIANAAEALLIKSIENDTWLLMTTEKGPAMLADKDFTVLRLYSISEFEEFYDALRLCSKD